MDSRRMIVFAVIAGLCIFAPLACSDETFTGPGFGDLEYTPSFVDISAERSVTLALENSSNSALGPIVIGLNAIFLSTDVNDICDGVFVTITPSSISSLSPGESRDIEVQFDASGADADTCTPGKQEAELPAAVDGRTLAIASVRFDWDGTPP